MEVRRSAREPDARTKRGPKSSHQTWSASFAVIPRRMRILAQLACAQGFCDDSASRMTTTTIQTRRSQQSRNQKTQTVSFENRNNAT